MARARAGQACGVAVGAALGAQAWRFSRFDRSEHHSVGTALHQFLLFDAMRLSGTWARRAHDRDCERFRDVQAEALKARLLANQDTAYGREAGFGAMLAAPDVVAAFRAGHPLTRYGHYEPLVDRIAAGERAVLNAEPESMLAATSGTSGRRALLPNTPTMSSTFFMRGILVIFDTMGRSVPDAFQLQKTCKLAFAPTWTHTAGGLRVGPNSSGPKDKSFSRLLPLYSTPAAGYQIEGDEATAMYVHALFAARDRRLGILEANFVSLPSRLLALLLRDGERIAADVETGRLDVGVAATLPAGTVAALERELGGGDAARAAEIRAALPGPGGSSTGFARRLWPDLKLILANATGAFAPYAERLQSGPGKDVPILSTVYAASEGLIGIGLQANLDGSSTYCLVPRAMFFEFLPVAPGAAPDAAAVGGEADGPLATLLSHELAVGQDYELVITNLGGLCRYRLGDVVRLVGFHKQAPVVEFRFRQGQLLNLRGEKTSEPQLAAAVAAAFPAGAVVEYSSAEVTDAAVPHYLVVVEVAPSAGLPADADARMDAAMCEANPVYATWRRKGAIGPCRVQSTAPGGFEALRRERVREGASPQQLKVSRVLRKASHVDLLASWKAPMA